LESTRTKLRNAEQRQTETNDKLAQMRKSLAAAHADLAKRHSESRSASDVSQRERQRAEKLEDELDLASRQQDSLRATAAKEVERMQAALRAAQETVRASKKQLETEQGALTKQLSRSRSELLETENNNSALRKKLDELKKRESTLRQSLQVTRTATEADARRKAQEVANLEAALAQTKQQASHATSLEARITELETELVQAHTAKSRAQSAHQSAAERFEFGEQSHQKEADSLRAELASVSEHAQGTIKALNSARHAQAEIERLQARWSSERQRLETERNEAQAKLAGMVSGSSSERAQLRSMSGAATRIRNERDALEARQVTLHATIDRLENELARAKEDLSEASSARDDFHANREALAGNQSQLQSQLDLAEQERDELRTEQQSLRVQLREWHNDYEHMKRERDSLRDERNRLTEQHLPLINDRNRLRDDLSPLRDERDAAIEALADKQAYLTQLKSDLETERERIIEYELLLDREPTDYGKEDTVTPAGRWHEALSNTRISNERLRTEVAHLRDELNTLSSKLQETASTNRTLDRRLNAAKLEATEAQKQQIQDLDWFMETLRVVQKS
jgi:chromosome segregation ATPase